jgi:hypothetical protein
LKKLRPLSAEPGAAAAFWPGPLGRWSSKNKVRSTKGEFIREEMMTIAKVVVWMLVMALGIATSGAWAQHSEHGTPRGAASEQLGEVNFPVSCSAAAQKDFNRAMAMFHSFWFEPAKESFAKVLKQDPECGMAHWGIAMMSMGNPFAWPPNANALKAGAASMVEAQGIGAKSERERDYIAALATFLKDWETRDHRTRVDRSRGEAS